MSEPTTYEIVIRGRASARLLRPLLDDFTVHHTGDGVTRLVGDIADPAHLHGVLAHLTSVNAEVISVAALQQLAERAATDPGTGHRPPPSTPSSTTHPRSAQS